jgi:glycosyltransferase involved in cell wall biosynthesis
MRAARGHVWVVPNGVTLPADIPPLPAEPTLLFVGSLQSEFNRGGVEWFVESCWPLVLAARPDARLILVGSGSLDIDGSRITRLGAVDDLAPVYAQARCCIVPLLAGAGTRLKVIEAMAFGRPVVSTPVGAEGLGLHEGEGVSFGSDAARFAEACVAALSPTGDGERSGLAGRSVAEARFTWDRSAAIAIESLDELSS